MKKMLLTLLISGGLFAASAHPPVINGGNDGYCNNSCVVRHTHRFNPYGHGYVRTHHRPPIRTAGAINRGYEHGYVNHHGHHNYRGCMHASAFQNLKHAINNAWFDRSRLQIAKQAIAANGISARQVLELMYLLDFESSRLDLAKFAYEFTFDRQNYFVVNNGFDFDSSIGHLNRFIYGYR